MDEFEMDPTTASLLALSEGLEPMIAGAQNVKARVLAAGFDEHSANLVGREFMLLCLRKTA